MSCIPHNLVRIVGKLSCKDGLSLSGLFQNLQMWPSSCLVHGTMELIKGKKVRRGDTRTEQMFRFPATEEIWEVACVEERDCEEREIQTTRKRRDLPIAS